MRQAEYCIVATTRQGSDAIVAIEYFLETRKWCNTTSHFMYDTSISNGLLMLEAGEKIKASIYKTCSRICSSQPLSYFRYTPRSTTVTRPLKVASHLSLTPPTPSPPHQTRHLTRFPSKTRQHTHIHTQPHSLTTLNAPLPSLFLNIPFNACGVPTPPAALLSLLN